VKNIYIIILLVSNLVAFSQAPKYSNEFLNIGVGARAFAMSNSLIANVNDVTAGYWNPAGLQNLPKDARSITLMHSEYFAGIAKYDYGSYARRIDKLNAMGVTFIRFGIDDIPNTIDLITPDGHVDYSRITTFSATDFAILFSYARKPKIRDLAIGGNVKIIRRKVGDFAGAWGFGLDFGMQYSRKKWKFGGMARDVTSTFNAWTFDLPENMKEVFSATGNIIPENSIEITLPKLLLGVSREIEFTPNISLIAELDIDATFDGKRNVLVKSDLISLDPHMGLELSFWKFVYLRSGFGNYQQYTNDFGEKIKIIQPNIGLGVKIKMITIDYALTDIGDQSAALYSNVFSLKFDFGKKYR
jgi:hypothetical protein